MTTQPQLLQPPTTLLDLREMILKTLGRPGRPVLTPREISHEIDIPSGLVENHLTRLVLAGTVEKLHTPGYSIGFRITTTQAKTARNKPHSTIRPHHFLAGPVHSGT